MWRKRRNRRNPEYAHHDVEAIETGKVAVQLKDTRLAATGPLRRVDRPTPEERTVHSRRDLIDAAISHERKHCILRDMDSAILMERELSFTVLGADLRQPLRNNVDARMLRHGAQRSIVHHVNRHVVYVCASRIGVGGIGQPDRRSCLYEHFVASGGVFVAGNDQCGGMGRVCIDNLGLDDGVIGFAAPAAFNMHIMQDQILTVAGS